MTTDIAVRKFLVALSNRLDFHCQCETRMVLRNAKQAYGDCWWCDICKKKKNEEELVFHCPKMRSTIHPNGYDYCINCAIDCFRHKAIAKYKAEQGQEDVSHSDLLSDEPDLCKTIEEIAKRQQNFVDAIKPGKSIYNEDIDEKKKEDHLMRFPKIERATCIEDLSKIRHASRKVVESAYELVNIIEKLNLALDSEAFKICILYFVCIDAEDVIQWLCWIRNEKYKDTVDKDKIRKMEIKGKQLEILTESNLVSFGFRQVDDALDVVQQIRERDHDNFFFFFVLGISKKNFCLLEQLYFVEEIFKKKKVLKKKKLRDKNVLHLRK
ncbi:hypothetical protein RFI_19349 [Reticulomyxa filosa]|uniref:Uncharacterized protein n=1 Tax=Reticulomyxa filosa TaxID=46433 RepID=X6MWF2_RETFI|nr:hypothetical protein RFI_19349 [Reticulomyxa filosa]|eukprot:ETO17956.1 hypothetical protein RFI_19349 [Reticulomyxa filosa]